MDSEGEQACAVRLRAQLPDRYRECSDRRCRSDTGAHVRRGQGYQDDDRAHRPTLVGAGITPHIPVWEKAKREDGTFSRSDFTFDKQKNEYRCPNGKALCTTGRVHDGRTILYRASKRDCDLCPLKARCCPNVTWRKVPRDVNEEARDIARALMKTPQYERSRDERKRVEMRFAHLKTHHRFERMRLRGLSGARDEFHLAAVVPKPEDARKAHLATAPPRADARHRVRLSPPTALSGTASASMAGKRSVPQRSKNAPISSQAINRRLYQHHRSAADMASSAKSPFSGSDPHPPKSFDESRARLVIEVHVFARPGKGNVGLQAAESRERLRG